jgi:hypothetical protein
MADGGVRMIGLGALGYDARPSYNKAPPGSAARPAWTSSCCTPEKLAECMAQIIRG